MLQVVLDALSEINVGRIQSQIKTIQVQREELRAFLQNHASVKYIHASEANFLLYDIKYNLLDIDSHSYSMSSNIATGVCY